MSRSPKNYRWWQEHGQEWSEVVAERKTRMPIYHLQEIFLEEYVAQSAPAKVLDFGCGFGRHLEYLRKLPKVDVYGYDQSESMVSGMRWATPAFRRKRIMVGKPLAKLPYDDDSFDLVFTVSVLIHVRPQDLDSILSELCRVSRNQIIHIENNSTDETIATSDAHDGCWAHDLAAAYGRVASDHQFEILPRCFEIEDIYRIAREPKALPKPMRASRAARFLSLDRSISEEIGRLRTETTRLERGEQAFESRSAGLRQRLEATLERALAAEEGLDAVRERARTAESKLAEAVERLKAVAERADGLEATLDEVRHDREGLRERARVAEDRLVPLQNRAREAEDRLKALQTRASEAEGRLGALRASLSEAGARIDTANEELVALRHDEGEQRERAREAESQLAGFVDRARVAETGLAETLARARSAEAESAGLRDRARASEEGSAELRDRARAAEADLAAMKARALEAEGSLRERLESLERARNRIEKLDEVVGGLGADLETVRMQVAEAEAEARTLKENEESAIARLSDVRHQLEVEAQRADKLDEALMRAHGTQERLVEQERAAQSRLIAQRNRAKRGEAKAEVQRVRARAAEEEIVRLKDELTRVHREQAAERERANQALGRIDDSRREQGRIEAELESMRAKLAEILGR